MVPAVTQKSVSALELALIDRAVTALSGISRTFNGISDTSTSPAKEVLKLTGQELAVTVASNFRATLLELLHQHRNSALGSSNAAEKLVLDVFFAVNADLLQEGRQVFRRWETNIPTHTKLPDLYKEMGLFYTELKEKFNNRKQDPIAFAAWIEQRLNGQIHPFTDGCGRVSRLLACFALIEAVIPYPSFPSRAEFFRRINEPLEIWVGFYRSNIT